MQVLVEHAASGEPNFVQPSSLVASGELAAALLAIAPGNLRSVTFQNSGAETVEAAIKACRVATGRAGILSMRNSFHGKTLGALSATGSDKYQEGSTRRCRVLPSSTSVMLRPCANGLPLPPSILPLSSSNRSRGRAASTYPCRLLAAAA
jgi:4-aminobutyrate aminotransferase-like enzyme